MNWRKPRGPGNGVPPQQDIPLTGGHLAVQLTHIPQRLSEEPLLHAQSRNTLFSPGEKLGYCWKQALKG